MRVLVACKYSGRVREAFRRRGYSAFSCDLLPAEDDSPNHFQADVADVIACGHWDMMIAHPPCTYLTASANRWQTDHWVRNKAGDRWHDGARHRAERVKALEFVRMLAEAPIPHIAIENPIGVLSSLWRKPDQIIHPWQFWTGEPGAGEVKATCLWLKGLPKLTATTPDEPGRHPACWLMPPSPTRWKDRSRTYSGIADGMAAQWG